MIAQSDPPSPAVPPGAPVLVELIRLEGLMIGWRAHVREYFADAAPVERLLLHADCIAARARHGAIYQPFVEMTWPFVPTAIPPEQLVSPRPGVVPGDIGRGAGATWNDEV